MNLQDVKTTLQQSGNWKTAYDQLINCSEIVLACNYFDGAKECVFQGKLTNGKIVRGTGFTKYAALLSFLNVAENCLLTS